MFTNQFFWPQGAVFDIKDQAKYNDDQLSTTDYIPKKPVMEHLKRVELRHNEKVQLYKQYTIDLKEKYHKFEVESQRHYANIIKKHQQQTDEIINNKEALLQQMKESKEQSLDELNLLRAKLYKAKAEGVSTTQFNLSVIQNQFKFYFKLSLFYWLIFFKSFFSVNNVSYEF